MVSSYVNIAAHHKIVLLKNSVVNHILEYKTLSQYPNGPHGHYMDTVLGLKG